MGPTLNELAQRLGKTKSALEYHVGRFSEEQRQLFIAVDDDGTRHFTTQGVEYLSAKLMAPDRHTDTNHSESSQQSHKSTESATNSDSFSLAQVQTILATVQVLTTQLEEKDRQLMEKDRQIRTKDEQIERLFAMVEDKPKKGFWARLFGHR